MYEIDKELMKNASGYSDPTAYEAIKNADEPDFVELQFRKLLHTIFHLCELAGFRLEGRITLVHKKTGRKWE